LQKMGTNLTPVEKVLKELISYKPGFSKSPKWLKEHPDIPTSLDILIVGLTGHGKSAFINTLNFALRKELEKVEPLCEEGMGQVQTMEFRPYEFTINKTDLAFRIWDTRGCNGKDSLKEPVSIADGLFSSCLVTRKNDENMEHDPRTYTGEIPKMFQAAIVVVSAKADEDELIRVGEIAHFLRTYNIPMALVITHLDSIHAEGKQDLLVEREVKFKAIDLKVSIKSRFVLQNYTFNQGKQQRRSETDLAALESISFLCHLLEDRLLHKRVRSGSESISDKESSSEKESN